MKQITSGMGLMPPQQGGSHFNYEVDSWLREMDFIVSEVSYMITRLAFVVDAVSAAQAIADAEAYQNKLLEFHEQLQNIREQIKQHKETLKLNKVAHHPAYDKKNATAHNRLRKIIVTAEKDYVSIKNDFNMFIAQLSGLQ
ncbi:MAG TPA: hypothetical protein PKY29_05095 [Ferruginibacter sp.]|nr:hypothetical protein [Ferruginibacter sp.]HRN80056.1 hypothetical protein [Ferruginibacter sp.]HRO17656.1 hypothetical protein [Ferruginibacter sp.]HRQ20668.1 hypothetical protein [Ferruginibacter sp.]